MEMKGILEVGRRSVMKPSTRRLIRDILLISTVGLVTLALFWLLYLGLYLGVEALFYPTNPTEFPADTLRRVAAIVLYVLYIAFLFSKTSTVVKAIATVAPNAVLLITIVLAYYQLPLYFIIGVILFDVTTILVYRRKHLPWHYYFALGYGTCLALLYAWPR